MIPTTPAAMPAPPETIPVDRLHRLRPEVYHGLVAQGLLASGRVGFKDGLLEEDGDLYRMPLDVYDRAADLELLGPSDRVELIDGLLVSKMTKKPPHATSTALVMDELRALLPPGWSTRDEKPVTLPGGPKGESEPEPDVTVVRGGVRDYETRHPGPADVALMVEIADWSIREDRYKRAVYGWANIPVYWIVNLPDRAVEAYARPTGPVEDAGYEECRVFHAGDFLPVVIDGREVGRIAVEAILPRARANPPE